MPTILDEPFVQLGDNTWSWMGDLAKHEQTNVGVIRDESFLIVIDANFDWAAQRILDALQAAFDLPVRYVVNTHYHVDHSQGNQVFVERAGATVLGGRGQREELLAKGQDDSVVQMGRPQDRLTPAAMELSGQLTFPHSGLEIRSIAPAHTGSDLLAWIPRESILFVGDLAVAWEHGNNFGDPDADIPGWITALEACAALEPKVVVPAHGRVGGAEILQSQRDFMKDLWALALHTGDTNDPPAAALQALAGRHPEFAVEAHLLGMFESMRQAAQRDAVRELA